MAATSGRHISCAPSALFCAPIHRLFLVFRSTCSFLDDDDSFEYDQRWGMALFARIQVNLLFGVGHQPPASRS